MGALLFTELSLGGDEGEEIAESDSFGEPIGASAGSIISSGHVSLAVRMQSSYAAQYSNKSEHSFGPTMSTG